MPEVAEATTDPLRMMNLREVAQRTGIPRTTILQWLGEDELAHRPGRRFPRPLAGKKLRWNEHAFIVWMERYHLGPGLFEENRHE